ncbi:MAG TPA: flagellar hook-basal body complex protein [Gemmatimonadales bacterium]|nr:flagellar hook-basal body complex protein [Gemmatimonadales bacterium]
MMRALFAGVSGLRNHQVRLDVIGNNIANVNTVAFKASRVTFEEAFAQLLQGASRPPGDLGGINPIQIGLGMNIGSIDQNFAQGNLESTGQATDLAIQGDGFFIASDGKRTFYTRAGNFQLDADGRLVMPTNGFVVQGINADSNGNLSTGTAITDIVLPFGKKSPARATTQLKLSGNLDAREQPLGTILTTNGRLFAIEKTGSNGGRGSDVNGLYARGMANNQIVGMSPSSTTVTVSDGTTTRTYTYVALDTGVGDTAFNSLNDLVAEINNDFATFQAAIDDATGAIELTANAANPGAIALSFSSSNPVLLKALGAANTAALGPGGTARTDEFSHIANEQDLLVDLRNGSGQGLGLVGGDTISVNGNVGGSAVGTGSFGVTATSTLGELMTTIDATLGLVNADGVSLNPSTGALVIHGDGGTVNALSAINIQSNGAGAANFNAIFGSQPGNYIETQAATDVTHDVAISVYDSIGQSHTLTITFVKDPTVQNQWLWRASFPADSPAVILGGGSGAVTFDSDGRLQTFTYDGGASSFQFDPGTGASSPVDIRLDSGSVGDINGLSQFSSPSNAVASSQDGYPMGNLQDISVDARGVITGYFTNGVSQTLAQIALASFNNPTGLLRRGDNMYEESGNSGSAVVGFAGTSNQSMLTPGALESSNVDISQEFTNMIIAQRGFQANARVITTADEMLNELVNLRR